MRTATGATQLSDRGVVFYNWCNWCKLSIEERLERARFLHGHVDLDTTGRVVAIFLAGCNGDAVCAGLVGSGVTADAEIETLGALALNIAHVFISPKLLNSQGFPVTRLV